MVMLLINFGISVILPLIIDSVMNIFESQGWVLLLIVIVLGMIATVRVSVMMVFEYSIHVASWCKS